MVSWVLTRVSSAPRRSEPVERVVDQHGADALDPGPRGRRPAAGGSPGEPARPGDGVADDLASSSLATRNRLRRRGRLRASRRARLIEPPEAVEGPTVDLEHGRIVPASPRDGTGPGWSTGALADASAERAGQEVQALQELEAGLVEGFGLERVEGRGHRSPRRHGWLEGLQARGCHVGRYRADATRLRTGPTRAMKRSPCQGSDAKTPRSRERFRSGRRPLAKPEASVASP